MGWESRACVLKCGCGWNNVGNRFPSERKGEKSAEYGGESHKIFRGINNPEGWGPIGLRRGKKIDLDLGRPRIKENSGYILLF